MISSQGVETFVDVLISCDLNWVKSLKLVFSENFLGLWKDLKVVEVAQHWDLFFADGSDLYFLNHLNIKIEYKSRRIVAILKSPFGFNYLIIIMEFILFLNLTIFLF